jgi:phosphoadenosine phosphosulfate reductase
VSSHGWEEEAAAAGRGLSPAEEAGRAVRPGDHAWARLPAFQRRVARALAVVERAARLGAVGVCVSGGKDSTVLLDLVRRVLPGAPAAWYDSGAELTGTRELVASYGAEVIPVEPSLPELCRRGHYWGHEGHTGPTEAIDFEEALVYAPARRFRARHGLAVLALGLRAGESGGRRASARARGELYWCGYDGAWHLCPLAWWGEDDVWAYLASRGLRYHPAYDRMAALGVPRAGQRVGPALGLAGAATEGRFALLRRIDPALFSRLAAEFPGIRRSYT